MKKIAIAAMKGGVGKTTISVNLAAELSKKKKVLLFDLDQQANATNGLGLSHDQTRKSACDVLDRDALPPWEIVQPALFEQLPNLSVLPSSLMLYRTELQMAQRQNSASILSRYFAKYSEYFDSYDYVIFDTAPGMGLINQNAFACADSILLVTDISNNGYWGIILFKDLWEYINESDAPDTISGILINNYDNRMKLSGELASEIESTEWMKEIVVEPYILSRTSFKRAEMAGLPLCLNEPKDEMNKYFEKMIKNLKKGGVL